jgi:hypothetical protein
VFIQGNLQAVFDALYTMGVIDPVLKMDWQALHSKMQKDPSRLDRALKAINGCGGHIPALVETMKKLDTDTVNFVALEVARELAEFTDNKILH